MKVLGLIGSPRKGSNTELLVDAILGGANKRGHSTSKVYLYSQGIGPCVDCRGCKKGDLQCIVEDGMQELYPQIEAAGAIVFGTPVYWLGPSGPMKIMIDRLRPYYGTDRLKGKKALIAAPAGDGPKEAELLVEMLKRTFTYLEMEFTGEVLGTGYERKDILKDTDAMLGAAVLGEAI
ncbi:MAG: flavodoxin family protein [bacterium]|nr:flavodoxin family protein [bacterium]